MRDLTLAIDGRPATLRLQSWSLAPLAQMASGQGKSAVTISAAFPGGAAVHELTLDNRHQRAVAAYLVNALQPGSPNVRVTAQRRNYDQSHYEMAFTTARRGSASIPLSIRALVQLSQPTRGTG